MGLTQITTGGVDDNINIDSNTLKVDGTNNRVGIGTAAPNSLLDVRGSSDNQNVIQISNSAGGSNGAITHQLRITCNNNANWANIRTKAFNHSWDVNNTERMRLDSSGRLLVGATSDTTGDTGAKVQVVDTGTPVLALSRNDTSITAGNTIGQIRIFSNDDSGYQECARIAAQADGTFGNNDKPTRLVFSVAADGAGTPTERLRIDSSGNVGVGVTPTAKFHVGGTIQSQAGSTVAQMFADGGAAYFTSVGAYPSIFQTNGSERMRIDSSGRLLVGTSSSRIVEDLTGNGPQGLIQVEAANSDAIVSIISAGTADASRAGTLSLGRHRNSTVGGTPTVVQSGDTLGAICFAGGDGTDMRTKGAFIACQVDGTPGSNDMPGRLILATTADGASSPTERMRITSGGLFKFSNTGAFGSIDAGAHGFRQGTNGNWALEAVHAATSGNLFGMHSQFPSLSPNNTSSWFYLGSDSSANRFIVYSNGGIANYQSNNVNLCDEREKKNIETLDSTWGCLKHWELKKFHYNEDADTDDKRYGVIAQQVAPHCPEVISDWVKQEAEDAVLDDDGNVVTPAKEEITRMAVKEQQMMWMAIKALQEAQTRIETLEAKVAALEAQ